MTIDYTELVDGPDLNQDKFEMPYGELKPGQQVWLTSEQDPNLAPGASEMVTVLGVLATESTSHYLALVEHLGQEALFDRAGAFRSLVELASLENQATVYARVANLKPGIRVPIGSYMEDPVIDNVSDDGGVYHVVLRDPYTGKLMPPLTYSQESQIKVRLTRSTADAWAARHAQGA